MGFGASAGSMNTILKNNRNMLRRKKTRKFEDKSIVYDSKYNMKPQYKEASPQLLRKINRRMTEERKRRETRIIIVFVCVMLLLTVCLLYLEGNYNQMLTMITE